MSMRDTCINADELLAKFANIGQNISIRFDKPRDINIADIKMRPAAHKTIRATCEICESALKMREDESFCVECGSVAEDISDVAPRDITMTKHEITFQVIGKGASPYQKSMSRTSYNYTSYSHQHEYTALQNIIFQHHGRGISPDIAREAYSLYIILKMPPNKLVFRGRGRLGIIGAFIYYVCSVRHIHRSVHDIAKLMNVKDRHISRGIRQMSDYSESGMIILPPAPKTAIDFIKQDFNILHIPDKYEEFVLEVIDRVTSKNLHITCDSRISTRCIGAIYLLVTRVPSLRHITKDTIATKCNISKTTFGKYYNMLCANYLYIRKPFKKHGIPMPATWKKTFGPREAAIIAVDFKIKHYTTLIR